MGRIDVWVRTYIYLWHVLCRNASGDFKDGVENEKCIDIPEFNPNSPIF